MYTYNMKRSCIMLMDGRWTEMLVEDSVKYDGECLNLLM